MGTSVGTENGIGNLVSIGVGTILVIIGAGTGTGNPVGTAIALSTGKEDGFEIVSGIRTGTVAGAGLFAGTCVVGRN